MKHAKSGADIHVLLRMWGSESVIDLVGCLPNGVCLRCVIFHINLAAAAVSFVPSEASEMGWSSVGYWSLYSTDQCEVQGDSLDGRRHWESASHDVLHLNFIIRVMLSPERLRTNCCAGSMTANRRLKFFAVLWSLFAVTHCFFWSVPWGRWRIRHQLLFDGWCLGADSFSDCLHALLVESIGAAMEHCCSQANELSRNSNVHIPK